MRVVLDTNVLVSALIFPGGPPEYVYRLVLSEELELVTSRSLLAELARVLQVKFGWDEPRVQSAVTAIAEIANFADTSETVSDIQKDPADNRVLEAALSDQADWIVSGDQHLLRLVRWREIQILKPADFMNELGRRGSNP